jgi:hypothetical protein
MQTVEKLALSHHDRATLEAWVRAPTTPQRTVLRSRIVLKLAEGLSVRETARRLGVSRHTVALWRSRFLSEGCEPLTRDRPGRGRKRGSSRSHDPEKSAGGRTGGDLSSAPMSSLERRRTASVPDREIWLDRASDDESLE